MVPPTAPSLSRQRKKGGTPMPPLGMGGNCEAVASQVKRDTLLIEKSFQKIWEIQKEPQ